MELSGDQKRCAVKLIRAVWVSPLDSVPESSGLPSQRDQNQREANAESFLIDSGIREASNWRVAQRSSTEGIDPLAPGDAAKPAPTPSTTNRPTTWGGDNENTLSICPTSDGNQFCCANLRPTK